LKIIFSRKGFDGGSGGVPSPIFPDRRMLSLPIPDKNSLIAYNDIHWGVWNVGDIVESLTNGKIPSYYQAHLDPDIHLASLKRHHKWRPIFGQAGASQGHLRNQRVNTGDLFVFFGLFQEVIWKSGAWKLNSTCLPKHVLWGWFQIDRCIAIENIDRTEFEWALYHPHFQRDSHASNTLYFATKKLDIVGVEGNSIAGAGIFPQFLNTLQLTAPEKPVSVWKLPQWMYPKGNAPALSYHKSMKRWEKHANYTLLQTVGRGQEFVLDCAYYPESIQWLNNLLGSGVVANNEM
jgi:hypothetical protein